MAKKFNGHRCERRNLTDLVLGTGPDGKKRAKPKAKNRPKNFFEPGGPTGGNGGGGGQDNTRVATPQPPMEYLLPQQFGSMEEYMAQSPYVRGGSGGIQNTFGPLDYALGTMPIGRMAGNFLPPLAPGFTRAGQLMNPNANRQAIMRGMEGTDLSVYDIRSPFRAGLESARALGWASTKATPGGAAVRNAQRALFPKSKGPRLESQGRGVLTPEKGVTSRPTPPTLQQQANNAVRKGAAEDALYTSRVQQQAQGALDNMSHQDFKFDSMQRTLLGNIEGLYNPSIAGRSPLKPSEMLQHNPRSVVPNLTNMFSEYQMAGIGVNRYGGPPQLNDGSPTANLLNILGNYGPGFSYLGESPEAAISELALVDEVGNLPGKFRLDNLDLSSNDLVMKYNAQQRAAQQPTGGQPATSIGSDLSYDYYEIDGEQVALPAGSPPPMGAAIVGDPDAAVAAVTSPDNSSATPDVSVPSMDSNMGGALTPGTYDPNATFSGTPLQFGNTQGAYSSFGDPSMAPMGNDPLLGADAFGVAALLQHGIAPNVPARTGSVSFGAPFAPSNDAMVPGAPTTGGFGEVPPPPMGYPTGNNPAAGAAGQALTQAAGQVLAGSNTPLESANRAVDINPFGPRESGLQAGLNIDMPDFQGMADAAQQKFDAFKKTSGFGQPAAGQPGLLQQLGSQEGRANIANTLLKPGTDLSALTSATGPLANLAKSGVGMMTDKIASTMEGDDGLFGSAVGGGLRAGMGALMMGAPGALPIAAVGAIGGLIKKKREMDLANKMDNQANLKTIEATQGALADYNTQVNSVMNERGSGYRFAQYGGPMSEADYETEGGEMMMASPNDPPIAVGQGAYEQQTGNMYKIKGPRHEGGGVPTIGAMEPYIDEFGQLQDSPYVYSDTKEFRIDPTPFLQMLS